MATMQLPSCNAIPNLPPGFFIFGSSIPIVVLSIFCSCTPALISCGCTPAEASYGGPTPAEASSGGWRRRGRGRHCSRDGGGGAAPYNASVLAQQRKYPPILGRAPDPDLGQMANLRTCKQARSGACQAEATSISVVKTSSD